MESSTVQEFPKFRGQKIAACSFEMCQLQIVFFGNPKQRLAELSTAAGYRGGLHQELHSLHWCHWWAAVDVTWDDNWEQSDKLKNCFRFHICFWPRYDMIQKYHAKARKQRSMIVLSAGNVCTSAEREASPLPRYRLISRGFLVPFQGAPDDLLCYCLVKKLGTLKMYRSWDHFWTKL